MRWVVFFFSGTCHAILMPTLNAEYEFYLIYFRSQNLFKIPFLSKQNANDFFYRLLFCFLVARRIGTDFPSFYYIMHLARTKFVIGKYIYFA